VPLTSTKKRLEPLKDETARRYEMAPLSRPDRESAVQADESLVLTGDPTVALRNIRMMHYLEHLAARFNEAGIPLMALKGAALHLTLYNNPGDRPMSDLDLMVRPADLDRAMKLMEKSGCLQSEPLIREDFFPRFHYEREYHAGVIYPVKIDFHIRPLRPLRFAKTLPDDALWSRAEPITFGKATVLVPSPEDMLIHLAAHSAIHGNSRRTWLEDIHKWVAAHQGRFDWDAVIAKASAWKLVLPVLNALKAVVREVGPVSPPDVLHKLEQTRINWRDRLVLRQSPRDLDHPVAHVLTNALCTPDLRFALAYLLAALVPDRYHMADWYGRCHFGWLPVAHVLRILSPLLKRIPGFQNWLVRVETRPSRIHGTGVCARQDYHPSHLIARFEARLVDRQGMYVGWTEKRDGQTLYYEITGKLRFLNHSCRPNARLDGCKLIAIKTIMAGDELTIDYGPGACSCRREQQPKDHACPGQSTATAA